MPTYVYANDNEIAARATTGRAGPAFPDVCHTPPPAAAAPKPPGVPTPYPNSCYPPDIRNGSRTVFIKGKEAALEKKAYFRTSYGDEPATPALLEGIISRKIKGRGFFTRWSPNVKIEGLCVDRHLDMVTYNHSNPANALLFPYLSRGWRGHPCQKEEERIKKACDEPDPNDKDANRMPRRGKRRLPGRGGNANANAGASAAKKHWTQEHCKGLLNVKNNVSDADSAQQLKDHLDNELAEVQAYLSDLNNFADLIKQEVEAWAIEKGKKLAVKALAKQAVGSFVPAAGNAVMGLWSAYDAASFATELAGRREEIMGLITEITNVDDVVRKASQMTDRAKALADGKPLTIDGKPDSASKLLGDVQELLALTSACLRARKCSLVPHTNKKHFDEVGKGNVETAEKGGCCPGQTGHHLIPGSSVEPRADGKGCQNYDHGSAPTVCVESANQHAGSHKRAHTSLARIMNEAKAEGKTKGWVFTEPLIKADNSIAMEDMIEFAVESHQDAFPLSRCSEKCIRAQLQDFYNKHCRNAKARMVGADGKPIGAGTNVGNIE